MVSLAAATCGWLCYACCPDKDYSTLEEDKKLIQKKEFLRKVFLEELSLNAWPALQTLHYDGWVFRFAGGYTRRANSINPLYSSTLPLEEKFIACERIYRTQGLPAIFKMTSDSQPRELDDALATRGYQADAHTSVQCLDLSAYEAKTDLHQSSEFSFAGRLTDEWLAAFCVLSNAPEKLHSPMQQILNLLLPKHRFAMLRVNGRPIACGLAVYQDGFVGMFDIVVAADQRCKGYGRCLMDGLLTWGIQQGAKTSYLQVMLNNYAALQLYAGMGYEEAYQYWYRIPSGVA